MPAPLLLGRSVVVRPGQAAPAGWDGCQRWRVEKMDVSTADVLGAAWRARTPFVIELAPGLGLDRTDESPAESITDLQPWEWEFDLDLVGERPHHALWANSVDGRDGRASYYWADQAVALGARIDPSGEADVVLPDGRRAICDGGPLDASLTARLGVATVHRIGLEHRSLAPLGNPDPSAVPLARSGGCASDERVRSRGHAGHRPGEAGSLWARPDVDVRGAEVTGRPDQGCRWRSALIGS